MSSQLNKVKELIAFRERARLGGGITKINSLHEKGKYTARERISLLLDEGSFEEFDMFVKHRCTNFGIDKKQIPGDGVVTGYGTIDGRLVFIYAQDFTVIGGTLSETGAMKICKIMDMAMKMGAPVVGINDSAGARIQEGVNAMAGYAEIFQRNVMASGVIPQISVIFSPSVGGTEFSPALTDFIIMCQEVGGVSHFVVDNEEEGLLQIRELLKYIPQNNLEEAPLALCDDAIDRLEYFLNEIIPDEPNKPYDVLDIIRAIVDDGRFLESQKFYAPNIITCFAHFNGQSVGIIANQPKILAGVLDINASCKAARFIRFCDAFNIPIVTLVDVPGFLPGTSQEYGGIITHGAKLLFAYGEATVPKVTVVLRKAYGGAYCVMSSKHLRGDINYSWPTGEIAVMGPSGAIEILYAKELNGFENQQEKTQFIAEKETEYKDKFANPYDAAKYGYIDDVIEPRNTRFRVIRALQLLATKKVINPAKKHNNIPL